MISVKAPLANSRINWICDSHSSQLHHIAPTQTTPMIKNNMVPRKSHNKMPRNNVKKNNEDQANNSPPPPKRKRDRRHRRERREREREREKARERENRNESFIHDARWATQRSLVPTSSSVPVGMTQSGPQGSDPISAMRPAVYHPPESVGNPLTNDNSPFQIDLESGEFPGLRPGLRRTARKKDLPHLPGLLRRAARIPGPGQGLSTPFSHAVASQTSVSRWKPPCPSQQPFYDLIFVSHRVRLPQALHAPTSDSVAKGDANAVQRYTAQTNAHLHGGIGVTQYKQK